MFSTCLATLTPLISCQRVPCAVGVEVVGMLVGEAVGAEVVGMLVGTTVGSEVVGMPSALPWAHPGSHHVAGGTFVPRRKSLRSIKQPIAG